MKAFYAIAVLVTVAASVSGRPNEDNIDWYDCSRKANGNYDNPRDCTRFITCTEGRAADMTCAACHVDPIRCPTGWLVFDEEQDRCLWADETTCGVSTPEPEPETTTNGAPEVPPSTGEPGEACDPQWCKNNGTCVTFKTCRDGIVHLEQCPENQFWESHEENCRDLRADGGECVNRDQLCPQTEEANLSDPDCLECRWESTGECARDYRYLAPLARHPSEMQTLTCRLGNVFDADAKLCRPCHLVNNRNTGAACCTA